MTVSFFRRWAWLGAAAGFITALAPGLAFLLVLVGFTCLVLYFRVRAAERQFVVGLFLAGFLVRAALSLGMDAAAWCVTQGKPFGVVALPEVPGATCAFENTRGFFRMGDSDYYSARSYGISRYAAGARDTHAMGARFQFYGRNGYLYVTGLFYSLFGFSPVSAKFLNAYWGAWLGVLVYFLGALCFHPWVGRWASLSAAFFPSLILWSSTHMKDSFLIGLGVLLPLLLLWILDRPSKRWPSILLFAAVFAGHASLRTPIYTFSLLACILYSVLLFRIRPPLFRLVLAAAPFLLAILFHEAIRETIAYAMVLHIGHTMTYPGLAYEFLPRSFYDRTGPLMYAQIGLTPSFLWAILQGIVHYLMEPFPWKVGSMMRIFAIPQLTAWYTALLLAAMGGLACLRRPAGATFALFLTTLAWTLLGALTNGNVGTVFRMRDMVTPFYLIFAAAGLWSLLKTEEGKC